ncbi:vanadium-dependent haloperoxidase [Derxia lacustris]|uniref:vanadium-dependent haloperoxidase n=1 Tax=Derxia lacustris TaxID=764842 RepID=UPI000A171BCC|nr:vanadium-dependent haloperoxidase [Derxia lacustris]
MNRFISRRRMLASAAAALSLQACGGGGGVSNNSSSSGSTTVETQAVTRWSSFVIDLMSELEIAGPVEARAFAMAFIAAHDALNAISARYARYALTTSLNQASANPDAAVAAAMYAVLDNQLQVTYGTNGSGWKTGSATLTAKRAQLKTRYDSELASVSDSNARALGVSVGQLAATAILGLRSTDGMAAALSKQYATPASVGTYQVTPDFAESGVSNQTAFAVGWGDVKPFAMGSVASYALPRPYGAADNASAVLTADYATDFAEVKAKGAAKDCGDDSHPTVCRSSDEKDFANFWWENSSTTWLRLAIGVANARTMTDWDKARLYALLEMAMSDASVASLYVKYTYQFWRPISAIRAAADDGNPATAADSKWTPLHTTPPWPDYASVHTACGAAAAAVLVGVIGSNTVSFTATSTTLPGKTRSYTSFTGAAVENGLSRIYIGYHFAQAVTDGLNQGNNIGDMVYKTFLTKL